MKIVERYFNQMSLKVMALRLMTSVLPHCSEVISERASVLERLFSLLGHTALMCKSDGSHYGDQGLLQKVSGLRFYVLSWLCFQFYL